MEPTTKLEPGTYRLRQDVKNPHPDKRVRHDWRCFAVWEAGMIFRVEEHPLATDVPPRGIGHKAHRVWHGAYGHQSFDSWNEKWEWLAPHLERLEEKPSDWIKREHGSMSGGALGALDLLVEDGVLTMEKVQEAVNRYYNSLED